MCIRDSVWTTLRPLLFWQVDTLDLIDIDNKALEARNARIQQLGSKRIPQQASDSWKRDGNYWNLACPYVPNLAFSMTSQVIGMSVPMTFGLEKTSESQTFLTILSLVTPDASASLTLHIYITRCPSLYTYTTWQRSFTSLDQGLLSTGPEMTLCPEWEMLRDYLCNSSW